MRVLLLTFLVGCVMQPEPDPGPGPGSGWTGPGGGGISGCQKDSECGSLVCSRDGVCRAASDVRVVHTTWTLSGMMANNATCQNNPDLQIDFYSATDEYIGYAPVPCAQGKFTVDKLPTFYITVKLGLDGGGSSKRSAIDDATGNAVIDLSL